MSERIDRLSDYLDGELPAGARAEVEADLERDGELRQVLEQLRAVRSAAGSLPAHQPDRDLWPGIEARIRGAGGQEEGDVLDIRTASLGRRRVTLTVPQLAAAAVALFLVGSTSVWLAVGGGSGPARPVESPGGPAPEAGFVSVSAGEAAESYAIAVRDLREQFEASRDRLDPETIEAVESSLATIDRAIERAEQALEADPANVYLNRHLANAHTRKMGVLQQAVRLARS